MCGLISVISKSGNLIQSDHNIFSQLLYANAVRGFDGTGVFSINQYGNIKGLKQVGQPTYFFQSEKAKKFFNEKYKILVGHNRKATQGKLSDENSHPFMEGKIILVHNGSISKSEFNEHKADVDSEVLCHALNAEKDYHKVLSKIDDDAYALIWYNIEEKRLYAARNSKRPLFLGESNFNYFLASEKEMLEWVLSRNNHSCKKIEEVPTETIYSWEIKDQTTLEKEKLNLTKEKKTFFPIPKTTNAPGTSDDVEGTDKDRFVFPFLIFSSEIGDHIEFLPKSYIEFKNSNKNFDGQINGEWIHDRDVRVRLLVKRKQVPMFMQANYILAKIDKIFHNGSLIHLEVEDAVPRTYIRNGKKFITGGMWLDHLGKCDHCGKVISKKDVETAEILLDDENMADSIIFCNSCKIQGLN